MTVVDDKNATAFLIFEKKEGVIFHENRLPDDSDKISCLICYFLKSSKKAARFESVDSYTL